MSPHVHTNCTAFNARAKSSGANGIFVRFPLGVPTGGGDLVRRIGDVYRTASFSCVIESSRNAKRSTCNVDADEPVKLLSLLSTAVAAEDDDWDPESSSGAYASLFSSSRKMETDTWQGSISSRSS